MLCPKLTDDKKTFDELIETTIVHELIHVVLWPMGAYIWNMTGIKDIDESNRAEEICVTHLEKIIFNLGRTK